MGNVQLARDLVVSGVEHAELRSLTRAGRLQHLRRGAYVDPADRTEEVEHLLLVEAAVCLAGSDSIASFGSAALLHGLPVTSDTIHRVHLTKRRNSGGRIRPGIHVHVAPLSDAEVTRVKGLRATSLDRTFVDFARTTGLQAAVAAGDVALRLGMDPALVQAQLEAASSRRGIRGARRAAGLIDPRSESVGESYSRVIMTAEALPQPDLQVELRGSGGFDARVDFLWREQKVIGEFDGRFKYGRSLRPGEELGDAVWREKRREDRLRDLGYLVVRWVWDDLMHPDLLAARIRRAHQLGAQLHR